jgi:hypothetical protein
MRERRRGRSLRELCLVVSHARSRKVRRRLAVEVATLKAQAEGDAVEWIQSVSEFDEE